MINGLLAFHNLVGHTKAIERSNEGSTGSRPQSFQDTGAWRLLLLSQGVPTGVLEVVDAQCGLI